MLPGESGERDVGRLRTGSAPGGGSFGRRAVADSVLALHSRAEAPLLCRMPTVS